MLPIDPNPIKSKSNGNNCNKINYDIDDRVDNKELKSDNLKCSE